MLKNIKIVMLILLNMEIDSIKLDIDTKKDLYKKNFIKIK